MRTVLALGLLFLVAACEDEEASPPADASDPQEEGRRRSMSVPGTSLDGFTIYDPDDLRNDPRAGEPWYIYLDYGEDAVRLPGPSFRPSADDLESLFVFDDPTVETYQWGSEAWENGIAVNANDRMRFEMKIDDFEDEVTVLAQVELREIEGELDYFIMAGNGTVDGVAHDIVITAVVDGVAGDSAGTYTVEMRGAPGP